MRARTIVAIVLAAIVLIYGSTAVYEVRQIEQAIVLYFGNPQRVVTEPGLHVKAPWPFEEVIYYEKRILEFDNAAEEVIAADQKRLVVDAFAFYRIADPLLFRQKLLDERNALRQMPQLLNSGMREVIGRVPLVEVVSGERAELMQQITDRFNRQASEFGIEVLDVRVKRVDLPKENSEAIYRRMETERQREAAEIRAQGEEQSLRIRAEADRARTVLISGARRESEILRGEGDAEVVSIFADAFGRDIDFFTFYRTMQAYRQALDGSDTQLVLSPDGDFLRYLNRFDGLRSGAGAVGVRNER